MIDIENLDPEEYEIQNEYSKNPFWSKQAKTENIDVEEFEYQQKLKVYKDKKEKLRIIYFLQNYRINMFGFISAFICVLLISLICFLCAVFLYIDHDSISSADAIFCGEIFLVLSLYALFEVIKLKKENIYKKLPNYKCFCKYIKKNRKVIRQWAKTVVPPRRPSELHEDEW